MERGGWLQIVGLWLRGVFRPGQVRAELDAELEFHISRQADEYRARGMASEDARELAERQLGNLADVKRRCRGAGRVGFVPSPDYRSPVMTMRRVGFGIIVPALIVLGAGTGWLAGALTPPRYRSEALMLALPPQVSSEYVKQPDPKAVTETLLSIQAMALSRTHLEKIMLELDLYSEERSRGEMMHLLIERMRRDIEIVAGQTGAPGRDSTIVVSYSAADPVIAMKVAERVAGYLKSASAAETERSLGSTTAFLEANAERLGRRLTDHHSRAAGRGAIDARTRIEGDTLEQMYAKALANLEESQTRLDLERRQMGGRLVLLDAPRLPEAPSNPSRATLAGVGALIGLAAALLAIALQAGRRAWRHRREHLSAANAT